jgi:hypothetical protein
MSGNCYTFSAPVRRIFVFASVLFAVLIITLPVAIYFFVKSRKARIDFDRRGFTVRALGPGSQRWDYDNLARLGTLSIHVVGGGPLVKLNGGAVAVNLIAKNHAGKTRKFMLSRFDRWQEILERASRESGLPIETVSQGAMGPAWPKAAS